MIKNRVPTVQQRSDPTCLQKPDHSPVFLFADCQRRISREWRNSNDRLTDLGSGKRVSIHGSPILSDLGWVGWLVMASLHIQNHRHVGKMRRERTQASMDGKHDVKDINGCWVRNWASGQSKNRNHNRGQLALHVWRTNVRNRVPAVFSKQARPHAVFQSHHH